MRRPVTDRYERGNVSYNREILLRSDAGFLGSNFLEDFLDEFAACNFTRRLRKRTGPRGFNDHRHNRSDDLDEIPESPAIAAGTMVVASDRRPPAGRMLENSRKSADQFLEGRHL